MDSGTSFLLRVVVAGASAQASMSLPRSVGHGCVRWSVVRANIVLQPVAWRAASDQGAPWISGEHGSWRRQGDNVMM